MFELLSVLWWIDLNCVLFVVNATTDSGKPASATYLCLVGVPGTGQLVTLSLLGCNWKEL